MRISYLTKGSEGPVTLYLHGLGADAAQTRPLASGVAGRSVLVDLPSHGCSGDAPTDLGYEGLVAIARAVAKQEGATQALGVSLGSAVLLRWLSTHDDLERAVLYLPAAVTEQRPAGRLRHALTGGDDALTAYVAGELPTSVTGSALARSWMADRAEALRRQGVASYADLLESEAPVLDAARASASRCALLAIGARDDAVHPFAAAEQAGSLFPLGRSHVFAQAAPLWTARRELRALISGQLSGSTTV